MWTLYACGLNPQSFAATEAAIVHNTYPDRAKFPKMIWSTNYYRLAAATMFTLFFAGRDFAPKCIINGINIQDYLQGHFLAAVSHLARRVHEAGDVENDIVFGWESMNEPNRGMVGYPDISVIPKEQALKKGTAPTLWQAMLLGSGRACEVDTWDIGGMGPYKVGRALVDPHGEIAWLPENYDDSRYGYKRDPGWKLGECVWAQHGVWDPSSDTLLRKDYFDKDPKNGKTADYGYFTNTWFMDFFRQYRNTIRSHHKDAIILLQGPTLEIPPRIKGTADDDNNLVYAPHFYDGITLMTKKWNRTWNVDVLGVLRGRYLHPAFAIKIGETAIRNCFKDQLAAIRQEGLDNVGNHPCILTEFGIPYDMDGQHAYKTGDYSSQSAAMDANHFAVEGSRMEGYTLWLYTAKVSSSRRRVSLLMQVNVLQNDHERGDQWNGEDLSIFSLDDSPLPASAVPQPPGLSRTSTSLSRTATASSLARDVVEEEAINPANLKRTLANPSISSAPGDSSVQLQTTPGYRAAEAYVRPAPISTAGEITRYTFDLNKCEFTLTIQARTAAADAPTVVFLPEYHFPKDTCVVEVTSGKWELSSDDDEVVLLQKLRWWHTDGEQTLKVTGLARKHNFVEGVTEDGGYYEQLSNWANNCSLM